MAQATDSTNSSIDHESPEQLTRQGTTGQRPPDGSRPIWRPSRAAVVAFVVMTALSVGPFVIARNMVATEHNEELESRAGVAETRVSAELTRIRTAIRTVSNAIQIDDRDAAFDESATPLVTSNQVSAVAVVELSTRPRVLALEGEAIGLSLGQPVSTDLERLFGQLTIAQPFGATEIRSSGARRSIGYVIGPPTAPAGTAVYAEVSLDSFQPEKVEEVFGPHENVEYALYSSPTPDPRQLVYATTEDVPFNGDVVTQPIAVGGRTWVLTGTATSSLVGPILQSVPWILGLTGLLVASLIAIVIEMLSRRRDWALGLVEQRTNELERQVELLGATQEKLVQQEKLAAIGQLASTVGHELRNPLGVVTNALYLLRTALGPGADERVARQLRTAEREIASATLIVSDLLDFAREREPMMAEVNLNELIDETLSVVPPPDGVEVRLDHVERLPVVTADRDQLRQVFLNLVTNAYEAMPEGGTLDVAAKTDGNGVTTSVTDNGIGMDHQAKARLFEPFFTQKMRGVGLGLTVTKRIVEAHHGVIDVRSEPGVGTSFLVTLPIDEESRAEV